MTTDPPRHTKAVAQRIDSSYHKRPSPMRALRGALVVLCAFAATLWVARALFGHKEALYNPGPVTASHAMFENNCGVCHDGGNPQGSSGSFFARGVSDSACTKCHDAALHSDKQTTLASLAGGKPVASSNCTTCHVEHKGHGALVGASDLLCTRCHDNLNNNVAGSKTDLATSVTAFGAAPAHPPFGRLLKQQGGATASDPTPLKFNHKKHLADINPTVGQCSTCHQMSTSGDRTIMRPVSYDAHCKSCHPMSLAPNLPEVPHERLDLVRLFTAGVPSLFSQTLATMTPEEKEKALTLTTERKQGLRVVKETKKITEAEWLDAQAKDLVDKRVAFSPASNHPAFKDLDALPPQAKTAAALELFAAYGMTNSCSYCHTLQGSPAALAKSPAELLHTLPTGFSAPPRSATTAPSAAPTTRPLPTPEGRRWFANSHFAHDAHRGMTCADCHAQAATSTLTTDVLLPDAQSCITCHHPGGRHQQAASSNCITCHNYHDRTREPARTGASLSELLKKKS
jgi:predicted CXXCH cytochrome family protein